MTSVAPMVRYGAQVAAQRRIGLHVSGESDRRLALRSCDFVVSAFSVGGFESMRHDLEIPLKYGIRQPIGDSIGPGGLMRALRSIPVMRQFAADAQAECPNAFFLNVSNPLSALTRVLANETDLRVVGLCNENV